MEHNEFVVEFNDGSRDWIDPVVDTWEDDNYIYVENPSHTYDFKKSSIKNWTIRPYDEETTYDPIQ